MANKRTIKSITIEKSILDYISSSTSIKDFTTIELINKLKEFKHYKYLKRTIWVILKNLEKENLIIMTGKKRNSADCYKINNIGKVIEKLKALKNEPILPTKAVYKPDHKHKVILSAFEVGKNIIEYVNDIESKHDAAINKIQLLEREIRSLEDQLIGCKKIIKQTSKDEVVVIGNRSPAGEKLFIFK